MPDTKISDLPLASAFDGSEYWVSSQGGTTVKMTTQNVYNSISKTYAEVAAMILTETLISGAYYYISDNGITLKALSDSLLSTCGCRVMRIVKNTYYQPSGIIKGVWHSGLSVSTNDVVVWGGKVWINQTGVVGSKLDDDTLDATNWIVEPITNDTYYFEKSFFVMYDFDNNVVSEQHDDRGNVIFQISTGDIERTDWGNNSIYNNVCKGIFNNSNAFGVNGNIMNGRIFNNSNTDIINRNTVNSDIYSNSNTGTIVSNSNIGGIANNSNSGNINANCNIGSISSNSNSGNIEFNSNSGAVFNNSNSGVISNNTNNGGVSNVGAANTNINNNINNGDISTTTTGDISDTIVNK